MNDPDQMATFSIRESDGLSEGTWTDGEFTADDEQPRVDRVAAFASLGFIKAALKRSAWLWCATAVAGLLIGYGFYVKFPPAYEATTSVLVTNNPGEDPGDQIQTDLILAESQGVAGRVVQQLGLHQSISSFIASSTVTVPATTVDVLIFTVSAPSSNDAVQRASALATDFLEFRAQMLQTQQQLQVTTLDQQVNQAQQQVDSINRRISQISAQPVSSSAQAMLSSLRAQLVYAESKQTAVEGNAGTTSATTQMTTTLMVKGSGILNPATPIPHSLRKGKAFYLAAALLIGLAIGMIIVVVRALVSDRLRLRNDIADAIAAPVRLSVGSVGASSWRPSLGRRATRRARDMRRIVAHLSAIMPRNSRGPAALAVVTVDNAQVVARAVAALAVSRASQGKQVVVADLSNGACVARLLGVKSPGVRAVSSKGGTDLVVAVPDRDDVAPVGPLSNDTSQAEPAQASQALTAAYASADLLLTLATLDPASGGEHLTTWATDVVAVITAGRSSAARINAVGEMIRLAGTRLVSVVLIGADKSDESLGVIGTQDQPVLAGKV